MKNSFLLTLTLAVQMSVFGTHDNGIDLIYDHIPGTESYVFTVQVYEIIVPAQTSIGDSWWIYHVENQDTIHTEVVSIDLIDQSCHTYAPGIVTYQSDTVSLGPIPSSGYTFYAELCCRRFGISNLQNSGAEGMRAEAYMYPEPGQNYASSSPRFLNPNYSFWVGNVTYSISQPAIDPDFDSIYYELIDLNGGSYGPVDYANGYSGTSPFGPNIPVFINQKTGEVSAQNLQIGIWSLNLQVSSFKNGILTSKINRDFFTVADQNPPLKPDFVVSNSYSTGSVLQLKNGYYEVELAPNDSLFFEIEAYVLANDSISMRASSSLLSNGTGTKGNCTGDCATFWPNPTFDSIHSAIGKFSFVADTAFLNGKSNALHKVWFHANSQDSCKPKQVNYMPVHVFIDTQYGMGLEDWKTTSLQVFPNPAKHVVFVESTGLVGQSIFIMNSLGQCIYESKIEARKQSINIQKLKPGVYFLNVENRMAKLVVR